MNINFGALTFRASDDPDEFCDVLRCHWQGYKSYGFPDPESCRDRFDYTALQLVCVDSSISGVEDKMSGQNPIKGCIRAIFRPLANVVVPYVGNKPNTVLAFAVDNGANLYRKTGHPLQSFFLDTEHPEISVPTIEILS